MVEPIPIVVDTDVGADPDDALALAFALASPEVDVRGVTIVSGDVDVRARIATRLLGMADRPDVPVVKGLSRPLGLGPGGAMLGWEGRGLLDRPYNGAEAVIEPAPAPEWLVETARRAPYHLVAIGPLSNVAAALRLDPGFADRLLGLTMMGGVVDEGALPGVWRRAVQDQGPSAWPDYNTVCDPTAAQTCAECGAELTWVPIDVTVRAPLRRAARERLPADRPLGAALGRMIDAWSAESFRSSLPVSNESMPVPADAVALLHDPLTVGTLFPSDWLTLRPVQLRHSIEGNVFRLRKAEAGTGTTARVAVAVDGARFEAFCIERILQHIEAVARY